MTHLQHHARDLHAPPEGQLQRYRDGQPITYRRYDPRWSRIGTRLPRTPRGVDGATPGLADGGAQVRIPGGSRTTWEPGPASDGTTFVVIDGAWTLPPRRRWAGRSVQQDSARPGRGHPPAEGLARCFIADADGPARQSHELSVTARALELAIRAVDQFMLEGPVVIAHYNHARCGQDQWVATGAKAGWGCSPPHAPVKASARATSPAATAVGGAGPGRRHGRSGAARRAVCRCAGVAVCGSVRHRSRTSADHGLPPPVGATGGSAA
jgi:hypothetical protein